MKGAALIMAAAAAAHAIAMSETVVRPSAGLPGATETRGKEEEGTQTLQIFYKKGAGQAAKTIPEARLVFLPTHHKGAVLGSVLKK